MKILVEGESYEIDKLTDVFDSPLFYFQNGNKGTINHVGYYHSFEKNQLVYLLPKVFVVEGKVFGKYKAGDLLESDILESFKHKQEFNWVRLLLIYFYNSLAEFRKRFPQTSIVNPTQTFELNSTLGEKEYSYLDLVLSFVNFYKKNRTTVLYHHIESISNQARKPKWEKTVRKSTPFITSSGAPVYTNITNKKKIIKDEEELLQYFFSILNFFNEEHHLNLSIDKSFNIIRGDAFQNLQSNGLSMLRRIKYRYFADVLKRMYQLCELYFSQTDSSSIKKKKEEFISVRNYNIVFEDMVDKLFSDNLNKEIKIEDISLYDLKYNNDGKIIDHLYEYQSLIDGSNIFYIGDSKYYKPDTQAGKLSTYKQFTYAKNVVQFNIDLFNKNGDYYTPQLRYRDVITEGYNISPNFFVYAYIADLADFENDLLKSIGGPKKSFHFEERLFDRDTLYVHQYKINFLFVLKYYSSPNLTKRAQFQESTKVRFRREFVDFFNDEDRSGFRFYLREFSDKGSLINFCHENFRRLNGKAISTNESSLLLAVRKTDDSFDGALDSFEEFRLN